MCQQMLRDRLFIFLHYSAPSVIKTLLAEHLPLWRSVCTADLQQVVVVLQLKVRENQGDGVSGLGQHSPGAVSIVVVLGWIIGGGDHPTLAPQCPSTSIISCKEKKVRKVSTHYCYNTMMIQQWTAEITADVQKNEGVRAGNVKRSINASCSFNAAKSSPLVRTLQCLNELAIAERKKYRFNMRLNGTYFSDSVNPQVFTSLNKTVSI